ncbi:adenylate/guanylate cyclase domain-containing protein [Methyloligella solikamskensis]|uniref:Adenylate/guanylate cyclase domain-containing protein n=1 Tax=Methyloligella solikamskensis TaxID=1177756 RepID=A0ABW3J964_9HYPH
MPDTKPVRVLYIEDDEGLAHLVKKGLERRGLLVDIANRGQLGLERVTAGGIDVVALDHYMADQDGLTTLEAIQKLADPPPVVYVTGTDDSRIAVAALKLGAADYVIKEVQEDFIAQLSAALNSARRMQSMRQAREAAELEVRRKNQELEALSKKLSKYLASQVYDSIFTGEQSVELASSRKKLTVFFSDLVDFTGTTEHLESEELTNLLNHYLTEMAKIANAYGATIDKYIGDAVLAFFGDPESRGYQEDASACVHMAVAMQRRMEELRDEWRAFGIERPFALRIGINTGFCTVGNFGSEDRMDYTIIGNVVNGASRLQVSAGSGGILIGHETYALVKDEVIAEERPAITAKGFAEPVRCYQVRGLYEDQVQEGSAIREESDGFRLLIDMERAERSDAIAKLEAALTRLKASSWDLN